MSETPICDAKGNVSIVRAVAGSGLPLSELRRGWARVWIFDNQQIGGAGTSVSSGDVADFATVRKTSAKAANLCDCCKSP